MGRGCLVSPKPCLETNAVLTLPCKKEEAGKGGCGLERKKGAGLK